MGELDVWVHRDGWAGHTRTPGVLVKRNPKRSRVRFDGQDRLVPNYAITERKPVNAGCGVLDGEWECSCGQCGTTAHRENDTHG